MARSKLNSHVIAAVNRHRFGAVYWRESRGIIRFYDRHDTMIHRVKKDEIFMHLSDREISAVINDLAQRDHVGSFMYSGYMLGLGNQSQMMLPLYKHAKRWIHDTVNNGILPTFKLRFRTINTLNNESMSFKIPTSFVESYIDGFIKVWK